jgi:hypothetical protein
LYDVLVAVRPDITLSAPVDLRKVCSEHPGFNIISGGRAGGGIFHGRDWDNERQSRTERGISHQLQSCPRLA